MRIQLSPWEVTETSIKLDTLKKRRKRSDVELLNGSSDSPSSPPCSVPIAVSHVHRLPEEPRSKKARRSKLQSATHRGSSSVSHSENLQPTMVVTLCHQIAVLGNDRQDSLDDKALVVKESADLQYTSRPDRSGAFLPHSPSSQSSSLIPALYDERHDRIYALQADYCRLVSWKASTGGPDLDATSVKLRKTAAGLSFIALPAGPSLVYGSCVDGSVFLARLMSDAAGVETWLIEYLPPPQVSFSETAKASAVDRIHVHTRVQSEKQHMEAGSKRKLDATTGAASTTFSIYQIFQDPIKTDLIMFKRQLSISLNQCSRGEQLIQEDEEVRIRTVLVPLLLGKARNAATVTNVSLIGAAGDTDALNLTYNVMTAENGARATDNLYFLSIALEHGSARGPSFKLPPNVLHLGIAGSRYVVAVTRQNIVFYDWRRGANLLVADLGDIKLDDCHAIVGDELTGKLAVLLSNNGKLCVATSSIVFGASSIPECSLTLAESLAASLYTSSSAKPCSQALVYELERPEMHPRPSCTALDEAHVMLNSVLDDIQHGQCATSSKSPLLEAFERALDLLDGNRHPIAAEAGSNGKETKPGHSGLTNGIHGNGFATLVNGQSAKHKISSSLSMPMSNRPVPPALVDIAMDICISILLVPRSQVGAAVVDDTSRLLIRLIKTGLVSTRRNLPLGLFKNVLQTLAVARTTRRSSYELILGLLRHTVDVSEYHMVCMIRSCMTSAPDAEFGSKNARQGSVKGVLKFLDLLVNYSGVNDALLRSAARDVLSQGELYLVIRLFAAYLMGRCRREKLSQTSRVRAMQWTGVLSELLHVHLPDDGKHGQLQQFISGEARNTENMVCVKRLVDERVATLASLVTREGGKPNRASSTQHPPYQIEHLVF